MFEVLCNAEVRIFIFRRSPETVRISIKKKNPKLFFFYLSNTFFSVAKVSLRIVSRFDRSRDTVTNTKIRSNNVSGFFFFVFIYSLAAESRKIDFFVFGRYHYN